jgi:predicted alpha/beta-fold hydrolase
MVARFVPSDFRPAWWLPGPHLQTLGARLLRARRRIAIRRERVELPDGDFLDLDHAANASSRGGYEQRPLVLVLHGLEGSARSGYALELYRVLLEHGIESTGLNFRSCSGELNRLPRLYHSGETGDLAFVLRLLAERRPGRRLGADGVSLGGKVLLKHLGESAESARTALGAAAAISVPFDLAAGASHLRRAVCRPYAAHLLRGLRRKVGAKRWLLPAGVDIERALAARDFREFDDAATAPLHGFASAEDYYRRSSSSGFLDTIRVPTLVVHAADDPFLPASSIPRSALATNPHLVGALTERGGHVGFVAGAVPLRPLFWAEREASRFLALHLGAEHAAAS